MIPTHSNSAPPAAPARASLTALGATWGWRLLLLAAAIIFLADTVYLFLPAAPEDRKADAAPAAGETVEVRAARELPPLRADPGRHANIPLAVSLPPVAGDPAAGQAALLEQCRAALLRMQADMKASQERYDIVASRLSLARLRSRNMAAVSTVVQSNLVITLARAKAMETTLAMLPQSTDLPGAQARAQAALREMISALEAALAAENQAGFPFVADGP